MMTIYALAVCAVYFNPEDAYLQHCSLINRTYATAEACETARADWQSTEKRYPRGQIQYHCVKKDIPTWEPVN